MKYTAVIVASGKGQRANLGYNKVLFVMKNGKSVLENSCDIFLSDKDCEKVVVVTDSEFTYNNSRVVVTNGGPQRSDSVNNGLKLVDSEYVLIHDGARPFLSIADLENIKIDVEEYDAAILAYKAIDTIKYSKDGFIEMTINRDNVYQASTPQGFKTKLIKEAYEKVINDMYPVTDDASVCEYCGIKVKLTEGKAPNPKLTKPEDFKNI